MSAWLWYCVQLLLVAIVVVLAFRIGRERGYDEGYQDCREDRAHWSKT